MTALYGFCAVSALISVCSSSGEVDRHTVPATHPRAHILEDFLLLQTNYHMDPAARKEGLVWSGDRPPNPITAYPPTPIRGIRD